MEAKALIVAATAHDGQYRKGTNTPYIVHPVRVAQLVRRVSRDERVISAALLHDVLEDVPSSVYSEDDMVRDFGEDVVQTVKDVSEQKEMNGKPASWKERKEAYIAHLNDASEGALLVSLADKLDNLTAILEDYASVGEDLWDRFNAGKHQQHWYYNQVYKAIGARIKGNVLLSEMRRALRKFKEITGVEYEK